MSTHRAAVTAGVSVEVLVQVALGRDLWALSEDSLARVPAELAKTDLVSSSRALSMSWPVAETALPPPETALSERFLSLPKSRSREKLALDELHRRRVEEEPNADRNEILHERDDEPALGQADGATSRGGDIEADQVHGATSTTTLRELREIDGARHGPAPSGLSFTARAWRPGTGALPEFRTAPRP